MRRLRAQVILKLREMYITLSMIEIAKAMDDLLDPKDGIAGVEREVALLVRT